MSGEAIQYDLERKLRRYMFVRRTALVVQAQPFDELVQRAGDARTAAAFALLIHDCTECARVLRDAAEGVEAGRETLLKVLASRNDLKELFATLDGD